MQQPANAPLGFHLLAKPAGALCNLDCKYCFFLSKELLYPDSSFRMTDEILESYIRQVLESQLAPEVAIAWQGGEPTLMGIDFFQRSVELAGQYQKPEQKISFSIQTNGTRLDDAWCAFFKAHNFLVGLSMDGPKDVHDAYRVNKGGAGTFEQVMNGWELLRKHQVETNILCTVHAANGDHPLEVYRFFRDRLKAEFMQFIPIVERTSTENAAIGNQGWSREEDQRRPLYTQNGSLVTRRSVSARQFGRFLIAIFDEWVRRDVGKIFVQSFDVALGSWMGQHNLCIVSPTCGEALALEHNGDLYSCDHYVEPEYLLGNIRETPMIEMVASDRQRRFGQDKFETLPRYCQKCDVLFACFGECPRNRFISTPRGEPGLNYLCEGYKLFFHHIDEPMSHMARLLQEGRPAAEIMQWYASRDQQESRKVGRNSPCPCGSGKKHKHCHGR
jgi:uncharacterized protein